MYRALSMFLVAITMLTFSSLQGFCDALIVYGSRNRQIKSKIISDLNTTDKKWKEAGLAYPYDSYMSFTFIPEDQSENSPTEYFTYTEFDLTKDKRNIKNVAELFSRCISKKRDTKDHPINEEILFQNGTEIRAENCLKTDQELIKHFPGLHLLSKCVHVGGNKYISYEYYVSNRNLSKEEINYWFEMFDYIRINY